MKNSGVTTVYTWEQHCSQRICLFLADTAWGTWSSPRGSRGSRGSSSFCRRCTCSSCCCRSRWPAFEIWRSAQAGGHRQAAGSLGQHLAVLHRDWGLVPSTHMASYNHAYSSFRGSSTLNGSETHMQAKPTLNLKRKKENARCGVTWFLTSDAGGESRRISC